MMERLMSDSFSWREIGEQVHLKSFGLCMLRKETEIAKMCVLLLFRLMSCKCLQREELCVKTGTGV